MPEEDEGETVQHPQSLRPCTRVDEQPLCEGKGGERREGEGEERGGEGKGREEGGGRKRKVGGREGEI